MRIAVIFLLISLLCQPAGAQEVNYNHTEREPWSILTADYSMGVLPKSVRQSAWLPAVGHGYNISWKCTIGKHFAFGPIISSHYFVFDGSHVPDTLIKYGFHDIQLQNTRERFCLSRITLGLSYMYAEEKWALKATAALGGTAFTGIRTINGVALDASDSLHRVGYNLSPLNAIAYLAGLEGEYSITDKLSLHTGVIYSSDFRSENNYSCSLPIVGPGWAKRIEAIPCVEFNLGLCYRFYSEESEHVPKSRIIRHGDE